MQLTRKTKAGLVITLVPLFAALNRLWGGDPVAGVPGRAIVFTILLPAAAAAYWFIGDKVLVTLMLGWAVYRSFGYGIFGGSLTPTTGGEVAGSALRFGLPVLLAIGAGLKWGWDGWSYAIPLGLYVAPATALSYYYGEVIAELKEQGEPEHGQNVEIELAHGALYGAALAAGWVLKLHHG